jgi:hypothetical protein
MRWCAGPMPAPTRMAAWPNELAGIWWSAPLLVVLNHQMELYVLLFMLLLPAKTQTILLVPTPMTVSHQLLDLIQAHSLVSA